MSRNDEMTATRYDDGMHRLGVATELLRTVGSMEAHPNATGHPQDASNVAAAAAMLLEDAQQMIQGAWHNATVELKTA